MRSAIAKVCAISSVFFLCGSLLPQKPLPLPAPASSAPAPQTASTINVIALDSAGAPAPGLSAADFSIKGDGQPLAPAGFQGPDSSGPGATEVVLVFDAVNTGISVVDYVRSEVTRFVQAGGGSPPLPVSFAVLQETSFTLSSSPSTDKETLESELKSTGTSLRAVGRSAGFYGASERFGISLRALANLAASERGRPGRKLVIWLSPGWAYFSGPRVEVSNKGQQALYAELVEVSQALREAGIVLYAIDPRGAATGASSRNEYYKEFLKPVRSAADVAPGDLSLQALAARSGGLVLFGSNSIASEISRCVREAPGLYTLALPPGEAPGYHALEVKASKPGVTVRAPSGYYRAPAPGR